MLVTHSQKLGKHLFLLVNSFDCYFAKHEIFFHFSSSSFGLGSLNTTSLQYLSSSILSSMSSRALWANFLLGLREKSPESRIIIFPQITSPSQLFQEFRFTLSDVWNMMFLQLSSGSNHFKLNCWKKISCHVLTY